MGRKSVSEEKKIEIASFLKICPNVSDVARKANVSRHCAINIKEKIERGEALANRIGQGRHQLTTAADDRSLKLLVKKDRTKTSKALAREWSESLGKNVSPQTVRRRCVESNMKSYVQKRKPFRNRSQVKRRKDWCTKMQLWKQDQWRKVIWSDESHFELINRSNRVYVRRNQSEQNCSFNFQPRLQGGGGQVSVCGCFTATGPGPILFYDGRLNSASYVTILSAALPQFIEDEFGDQDGDYFFMQDNAPCHKAKSTIAWLQNQQIPLLPWPPTSPDLNPIENIWSIIDQKLTKMKISSIPEMKEAIKKIWFDIEPDTWSSLVDSLAGEFGCVQKVLKVKGRSCSQY